MRLQIDDALLAFDIMWNQSLRPKKLTKKGLFLAKYEYFLTSPKIRFATRHIHFMYAYHKGLNSRQTAWQVRSTEKYYLLIMPIRRHVA